MSTITKSEFSRLAGVTRQAVNALSKGILSGAIVDGKVDTENPAVHGYLMQRGKHRLQQNIDGMTSGQLTGTNAEVQAQIDTMTLQEMTRVFGTGDLFRVWAIGRKMVLDIEIKQADTEAVKNAFVDVRYVEWFSLLYLDILDKGLHKAAPKIAADIIELRDAGADRETLQQSIRQSISKVLKATKKKAAKELKKVE